MAKFISTKMTQITNSIFTIVCDGNEELKNRPHHSVLTSQWYQQHNCIHLKDWLQCNNICIFFNFCIFEINYFNFKFSKNVCAFIWILALSDLMQFSGSFYVFCVKYTNMRSRYKIFLLASIRSKASFTHTHSYRKFTTTHKSLISSSFMMPAVSCQLVAILNFDVKHTIEHLARK